MANTSISIRMDADLKRQFEAFCSDMGMTMTTAINVFARKAVREYRIPFEISGDVPNAETVEAIKEVKKNENRSEPRQDLFRRRSDDGGAACRCIIH